jgi:4-amino-4-deoxy-L-arabinose transferase-like glycosyltransferase
MHTELSRATAKSSVAWDNVWLCATILLAISILIRLIDLNHLPRNDELYTVLAARGWLVDGVPRIADGVYGRAQLYTIIVAEFFRAFGESMVVARLPSLLAGSALVVAVFLWTRWVAGNLAAWIAALFVCLSPLEIELSQYARFYTFFGLFFWLGAIGAYALVEQDVSRRAALPLALGALACLALAFHFQPLTTIGVVALGVWLALSVALPWLWAQRQHPRRFWTIVGIAGGLLLIGAAVMVESETARALWLQYRHAPLHAMPRNVVWFYQLKLIERWPALWPVFPFIALFALTIRPRAALFCCCLFIATFTLMSLAAMKHFIYIAFVLPFLFVIWAIALARAAEPIGRWVVRTTDGAISEIAPALPGRATRWGLLAASVLFLIISNGAPARTLLKPLGIALSADETSIDWRSAAAALRPWLEHPGIVLTPNDLHALYYLGGYDIAVNPSRLSEIVGHREFSLDPRTGRPVIGTATSLRLIMSCYPTGVLIADATTYPPPWIGTEALGKVIQLEMTPIDLQGHRGLFAFHWDRSGEPPPPNCTSLKARLGACPSNRKLRDLCQHMVVNAH